MSVHTKDLKFENLCVLASSRESNPLFVHRACPAEKIRDPVERVLTWFGCANCALVITTKGEDASIVVLNFRTPGVALTD